MRGDGMSLSGEEFLRFLILVIPGFWGLWVYKPFVYRGDDGSALEHDFILAAMFALPGYLIVTAFFEQCHLFIQILCSTLIVFAVSVATGMFIRKFPHPLYWFAKKYSEEKGAAIDTPYGRALTYVRDGLVNKQNLRDGNSMIAVVYPVGDREKAETGTLLYHTARFNEVELDTRPPIPLKFFLENDSDISPWCKTVNLDSGIVVEIANIKTEILDRLYDEHYGITVSSPAAAE
jgi:hypothetical protein